MLVLTAGAGTPGAVATHVRLMQRRAASIERRRAASAALPDVCRRHHGSARVTRPWLISVIITAFLPPLSHT